MTLNESAGSSAEVAGEYVRASERRELLSDRRGEHLLGCPGDRFGVEALERHAEGLVALEQFDCLLRNGVRRSIDAELLDRPAECGLGCDGHALLQVGSRVVRGVHSPAVTADRIVPVSVEDHLDLTAFGVLVLEREGFELEWLRTAVSVLISMGERHLNLEPGSSEIQDVVRRAVLAVHAVRTLGTPQASRGSPSITNATCLLGTATVLADRLVQSLADSPVHLRDLVARLDDSLDHDEDREQTDENPVQPDRPGGPVLIRLRKERRCGHGAHPSQMLGNV